MERPRNCCNGCRYDKISWCSNTPGNCNGAYSGWTPKEKIGGNSMIEIIDNKKKKELVSLGKMQAMEIGVITNGEYAGNYVLKLGKEAVDLTDNTYWPKTDDSIHKVRLLNPNESITIKLYNK